MVIPINYIPYVVLSLAAKMKQLKTIINQHQPVCYLFVVFIMPFMARLIPELFMGEYPAGFDPMGYYVPIVSAWGKQGVNVLQIAASAPLFYSLILSMTKLGVPLILSLKIIAPLLHGFLSLSIYLYANKTIKWSHKKSIAVSLVATLYFIGLRTSWDMFRVQLGLIFIFVALAFQDVNNFKGKLLTATALLLVAFSDQYTTVVVLSIVLFKVLRYSVNNAYQKAVNLVLLSLPAIVFFVISIYANSHVSPTFILEQMGFPNSAIVGGLGLYGFSSYPNLLVDMFLFLLFSYSFLFLILIKGKPNLKNDDLKFWFIFCLFAAFFPVLFSSARYRWILLLIYPLSFYVVNSMAKMRKIYSGKYVKIVGLFILLISVPFMILPSENSISFFNSFTNYVPSTMLSNTVPLSDCPDVQKSLSWLNNNAPLNSCLITHTAFYGWSILYAKDMPIRTYGYGDPELQANTELQQNFKHVYLIWWINGSGLHGQPTVPATFTEIYTSNKIAVYEYRIL